MEPIVGKQELGVGDAVEVRFVELGKGDVWRPATVVYVESHAIGVAFNDGTRLALPKGQGRYR